MQEEEYFDGPLPHWANGHSGGQYLVGAQLPTRDGRRTGNAHIIESNLDSNGCEIFTCITDAGNQIEMTERELITQFHEPTWMSDVDEILAYFDREYTQQQSLHLLP